MKIFAFAIPIVIGMVIWASADTEIVCTREGAVCLNCTTLAYCKKVEGKTFEFTIENEENCVVNFVCDEWNLQCVRNGICRSTSFSCPTFDSILLPDPYSCTGYYSCAESFPYQCGPKTVFHNGSCVDYVEGEPRCNDYPVLCEKDGEEKVLDGFTYVCKEETIDGMHIIHPVVKLP